MSLYLQQLALNNSIGAYDMLQRIGTNENEFKNTAHGLSEEQFTAWIVQQKEWAEGKNLPEGYVPQTVYWLYDNDQIVGMGKIRHALNDNSRKVGGNIGYSIDPHHRGKGYATQLLKLLVAEAHRMELKEILLTVEKYNPASKRVIEKAGGTLLNETNERWYFTF